MGARLSACRGLTSASVPGQAEHRPERHGFACQRWQLSDRDLHGCRKREVPAARGPLAKFPGYQPVEAVRRSNRRNRRHCPQAEVRRHERVKEAVVERVDTSVPAGVPENEAPTRHLVGAIDLSGPVVAAPARQKAHRAGQQRQE